jgi:hypothetical protein
VNKGGTGNSTPLTNGQLWVGSTGNTPSIGTITAGTNISVTNGAGTITVANTAAAGVPNATYILQTSNGSLPNAQALSSLSTGLVKVTTGTGVLSTAVANTDYQSASANLTSISSITPTIGTLPVGNGSGFSGVIVSSTAGTVLTSNGTGSNPTWQSIPSSGVVWQDIGSSTSVNLVANNGYITAASNPLFTLPALPAVGDTYLITGRLSGTGYRVNLQIFDIIEYNGALGSLLTTTAPNAAITIVCTVGGTPAVFCVLSTNGSTFTLT